MGKSNINQILKSLQEHYLSKDYDAAAKLLIKHKDELDPGLFHYNLGTVHTKSGNLAAGRYHLEKSIKNNFVNTKVLNNISFIERNLAVADLSNSNNLSDQTMNVSLKYSAEAYLGFTLICLLAVLFAFKKKIIQNKYVVCLFVLLTILPIGMQQLYLKNINYAILLKDTEIREGPSAVFVSKSSIQAGSKVIVGEFEAGWVYIKYPIEHSGWLKRSMLGIY
ncbi:MAG: hypothetical protein HN576_04200 [Bacteriovoracaceae bacterium]|jgi:hypothetical protein|nr:hypothetical protein [Bacteriovoracaceae bacterium]